MENLRSLDASQLRKVRGGVSHETATTPVVSPSTSVTPASTSLGAATPSAASTVAPSLPRGTTSATTGQTPSSPVAQGATPHVAAQVQQAAAAGATPQQIEEMVTLYHLGNADFGKGLAAQKKKGTMFDQLGTGKGLGAKIDVDYSKKMRAGANEANVGRGGDDLGPGFYTTTSKAFVDDYMEKNFKGDEDAGVLSFEMRKKDLEAMKKKDYGPKDEAAFQQNMKDGFYTQDAVTGRNTHAKLDTETPTHDVVSGPINDVKGAGSRFVETAGVKHNQGTRLEYADGEIPLQYAFRTEEGARTLYDKSKVGFKTAAQWEKDRKASSPPSAPVVSTPSSPSASTDLISRPPSSPAVAGDSLSGPSPASGVAEKTPRPPSGVSPRAPRFSPKPPSGPSPRKSNEDDHEP